MYLVIPIFEPNASCISLDAIALTSVVELSWITSGESA